MRKIKSIINFCTIVFVLLILNSCSSSDGFSSLDLVDDLQNGPCEIIDTNPSSGGSLRFSALNGTREFSITPSFSTCKAVFKLNGETLSTNNKFFSTITSNALGSGSNILEVTLTGSGGTDKATWTIVKNNPPNCALKIPNNSYYSLPPSDTLDLNVISSNPDNDTLTFNWTHNGEVSSYLDNLQELPNGSSVTFSPAGELSGVHTVSVAISDDYDTVDCSWQISLVEGCAISSANPVLLSSVKMASIGAERLFTVIPNNSLCAITYNLNGIPLDTENSPSVGLTSDDLILGANILQVTVGSGVNSESSNWTVVKNIPPTCSYQNNPGSGLNPDETFIYDVTSTNLDNDLLSFGWKLNGLSAPLYLTSINDGNSSTGTFTPTSSIIGTHVISVDIYDGYDYGSCTWNVSVIPFCTITNSDPLDEETVKVSSSPSGSKQFTVFPNLSSCVATFRLNSNILNTNNNPYATVNSAQLNDGNNDLEVTIDDGYSSDSASWTVIKNIPPLCESQNPNPAGNIVNYNDTIDLSVTITNSDSDPIDYSWLINNVSNPALFTNVSSDGNNASARFTPNDAIIGLHNVSVSFNDGYDTANCNWSIEVIDPTAAEIISWSPLEEDPVIIKSEGIESTRTFSVVATGTGLTYKWYLDDALIVGATTATINLSSSGPGALSPGEYVLEVVARDAYGREDNHVFNVKRNAPPVINITSPKQSIISRVNYASSLNFHLEGSDGNNDSITYSWLIDNQPHSSLPATIQQAPGNYIGIFNPNSATELLGRHTIRLTATDGIEQIFKEWTVDVNYFSQICNDLISDDTVASRGKICTIAGTPGVGDGVMVGPDEILNQYYIRTEPRFFAVDNYPNPEDNNLIFTDIRNHVVWYYNRTGSTISRFGYSIGAYSLKSILGAGQAGASLSTNPMKLNTPIGLALNTDDPSNYKLYVADYGNHMVYEIDKDRNIAIVLGTGGGGAGDHDATTQGYNVICQNPWGLAYRNNELYVSCYSSNGGKVEMVDTSDQNYWTTQIVRSGGNTTDGLAGFANPARTRQPRGMRIDSEGVLFWAETCNAAGRGGVIRAYNSTGTSKTRFGLEILPYNVKTILGNLAAGCSNTEGAFNALKFNHPYDIELTDDGMWIVGSDYHRIMFVNNSGSPINYGGYTVDHGEGRWIINRNAGTVFNGDNLGTQTRIWSPTGVSKDNAGRLYFADTGNNRLRSLNIGGANGYVTTHLGGGFTRWGSTGDGGGPAPDELFYNPRYVAIDSTNNYLYLGDYSNQRIRRIDMTSGVLDNYVGRAGGNYGSNVPRSWAMSQWPAGMLIYDNMHLIYANTFNSVGTNRPCLLRIINNHIDNLSLWGYNLPSDYIYSIGGNYALGCAANTNAAFTPPAISTDIEMHYSEGLALAKDNDGNDVIYIAQYNNHCILKMDSNQRLSSAIGTCATQGNAIAYTDISNATLRFPIGIATDPDNPTNIFITDQTNQGTQYIRYANFSNSTVNSGLFGLSVESGKIRNVLTVAGSPWLTDVVSFGNQLCYSTGRTDQPNIGHHNIICKSRDLNELAEDTLRCGAPSSSTLRGASPLGSEHEGVHCNAALLANPWGMAFDSNGNLYFADRMNHMIRFIKRWW